MADKKGERKIEEYIHIKPAIVYPMTHNEWDRLYAKIDVDKRTSDIDGYFVDYGNRGSGWYSDIGLKGTHCKLDGLTVDHIYDVVRYYLDGQFNKNWVSMFNIKEDK